MSSARACDTLVATLPTTRRPVPMSARPRIIRCAICERVEPCTFAELLRFTWQGWPTCCGEVMALINREDRRTSGGPTLQTSALPTDLLHPPDPRGTVSQAGSE